MKRERAMGRGLVVSPVMRVWGVFDNICANLCNLVHSGDEIRKMSNLMFNLYFETPI